MKRHEQLPWEMQQANMFGVSIVQIALSPTSLKKQQLELEEWIFWLQLWPLAIYILFLLSSSDENPSPQFNVEIRCKSITNVIVNFHCHGPIYKWSTTPSRTYVKCTSVHSIRPAQWDYDKRSFQVPQYWHTCIPYILLFLLLSQQFSSSKKCRTMRNLCCKYHSFSSHSNFPPFRNRWMYGNIQLISISVLFDLVQITALNGLMFHVECAGSHESVRLKFTITKQVVLASPTTCSGKNRLDKR